MGKDLHDAPTWREFGIKLLKSQFPSINTFLQRHPQYSVVCELKSVWNPIVTAYDHGKKKHGGSLAPLAIIGRCGAPEYTVLRYLCPEIFDGAGFPKHSQLTTAATFEKDAKVFIQKLKAAPETFGRNPEGLVVYLVRVNPKDGMPDKCYPCMKVKDEEYKVLAKQANQRAMPVLPGSVKDLMEVQQQVIHGTWDDESNKSDESDGKEIDARGAHVTLFETALREMVKALVVGEGGEGGGEGVYHKLYAKRGDGREYARLVKALPPNLLWLQNTLYKSKGRLLASTHADFDAQEFLFTALKTSSNKNATDKTLLKTLQNDRGLFWWKRGETPRTPQTTKES